MPPLFARLAIMRMKLTLLLLLVVLGCRISHVQSNTLTRSTCSVAAHTDSGELAVVCRPISAATGYRLSGSRDTRQFDQETAVWLDFEPSGVRVSNGNGRSVRGLRVAKQIILKSRQWPWFKPVSDMVCVAGRE